MTLTTLPKLRNLHYVRIPKLKAGRHRSKPEAWKGATADWSPVEEQAEATPDLTPVELLTAAGEVDEVHNALSPIDEALAAFRSNMDAVIRRLVPDPQDYHRVLGAIEHTQEIDLRELEALLAEPELVAA